MNLLCKLRRHGWSKKYFKHPTRFVDGKPREFYGRECHRCERKEIFISLGLDGCSSWVEWNSFVSNYIRTDEAKSSAEAKDYSLRLAFG